MRSDRRLLRRLVQNLVSNAIKYTPAGRVLVGCRRRGEHLRIDVYDTGIGIPHSKRRAIFKEFHRLDQGARVARGVGLGLSIVERIARVLDCEVALKSDSRPRLAVSPSKCRVDTPRRSTAVARRRPRRCRAARRHGRALHRQRARHSRRHGNAAGRLGLPRAQGGRSCRGARGDRREAVPSRTGLLVDYHLDGGNGIGAIAELRRRLVRRTLPAILITADRSRACARGGARRRHSSAEQADQAGRHCAR